MGTQCPFYIDFDVIPMVGFDFACGTGSWYRCPEDYVVLWMIFARKLQES
jgi:hypothetical protein